MIYPEKYVIEPSKRTPWIIMEPGRIFIMGRSIPENPGDFYKPVQDWVSQYALKNAGKSRIDLGFEYINTSSTKWIYTILKVLSDMQQFSHRARITWYYEIGDDDLCELGVIMKSLVDCPFAITEVDDMGKKRYDRILSASV
jgi:hypothetical protein